MKKISITLLTLSLTSALVGQNTTTNQEDVKKEGQYENQYKTSSNFYINSDGLVVYKRSNSSSQEDNTVNNGTYKEQEPTISKTHDASIHEQEEPKSSPAIIKKNAYINIDERKQERNEIEPALVKTTKKAPINEQEIEQQAATPYTSSTISSGAVKKEALTVDQSISINSKALDINNSEEETVNYDAINNTKKGSKTANSGISQEEAKKKYKKYNSYEKRPSTYKSIEEAALAVDAMIEELKKKQGQATGARSMSSRLSTGANRASLRKKPLSSTSIYNQYDSKPENKPSTSSSTNDQYDEWGDEPTYYINGTEVEQSDVNLLKKKDIIRKEFKIRNTVSGNPNGEIWYEVQNYQK